MAVQEAIGCRLSHPPSRFVTMDGLDVEWRPTAMPEDRDPLVQAEAWLDAGRQAALATVVETWGSAPRPVGSHLVIDETGHFEGSVSGGCVEASVVVEALEVIATGQAKLLTFGVTDEAAWTMGLACGGRISVFVERLEP